MSASRDARRCALQELFQRDCGNGDEGLVGALGAEGDTPASETARRAGAELASSAWQARHDADLEIGRFTPEWPTHRQPAVDRNVLRLAWWEMTRGGVPAPIAINEAVELAREYGAEKSPAFVNAVLDRVRREREGS